MMYKNSLVAVVVAAGSVLTLAPIAANAQLVVQIAPPSPVYEAVPAPRSGYVWAPGHHEWRNGQYTWVQGHWLQQRPGYAYVAPRWVERGNGRWHMVGGNWERGPGGDRDGDGIANRYDRDRDGDGIPNRADDRPNRNNDQWARNRFGPRGDLDRDGIMNRDDRDRDGDGVRNNRDRWPNDRRRS